MKDRTRIKVSDVPINERNGFSYRRIVSEKDGNHNILMIDVTTTHPLRRVLQGLRYYFVLAGSGTFVIDGEKFEVADQEIMTIQAGQEYRYEASPGGMSMLELNVNLQPGPLHEDLE